MKGPAVRISSPDEFVSMPVIEKSLASNEMGYASCSGRPTTAELGKGNVQLVFRAHVVDSLLHVCLVHYSVEGALYECLYGFSQRPTVIHQETENGLTNSGLLLALTVLIRLA